MSKGHENSTLTKTLRCTLSFRNPTMLFQNIYGFIQILSILVPFSKVFVNTHTLFQLHPFSLPQSLSISHPFPSHPASSLTKNLFIPTLYLRVACNSQSFFYLYKILQFKQVGNVDCFCFICFCCLLEIRRSYYIALFSFALFSFTCSFSN